MDPAPPPAWHSAIRLDPAVQPRAVSRLPGYEGHVEQCGEFAYRYFRSQGKGFPTLGQPLAFLRTGRDERGRLRPAYGRYLNPGPVPPRAGDLLVGAGPGWVHTAIVERVDARGVHVFQANVPPDWRGGRQVKAVYPLVLRRGVFLVPPLGGLAMTGWIRPTGRDALP